MEFRSVDISAITFEGLTTARQRRTYFRAQLVLFAAAAVLMSLNFQGLTGSGFSFLALIGGVSVIVATYAALWPKRRAALKRLLHPYSLDAYLTSRDAKIIQRAYNEVIRISKGLNFVDALKLRVHEPAIEEFIHLKIIAYQRKGLLRRWLIDQERLEHACRFLYLCAVAEQRQADHLAGRESTKF